MSAPLAETPRQLFIDGRWTPATEGATFTTVNPTTGRPLAEIARASAGDVAAAVGAARHRFDETSWGHTSSARERAAILLRVAQLLRSNAARLAELETLDSGKLLADSLADVEEAAFQFEFYAGCATRMSGTVPAIPGNAMSIVLVEPIGVVGLITP